MAASSRPAPIATTPDMACCLAPLALGAVVGVLGARALATRPLEVGADEAATTGAVALAPLAAGEGDSAATAPTGAPAVLAEGPTALFFFTGTTTTGMTLGTLEAGPGAGADATSDWALGAKAGEGAAPLPATGAAATPAAPAMAPPGDMALAEVAIFGEAAPVVAAPVAAAGETAPITGWGAI
jgi:hypothetical protein